MGVLIVAGIVTVSAGITWIVVAPRSKDTTHALEG